MKILRRKKIDAGRTAMAHYEKGLKDWRARMLPAFLLTAVVVVAGAVPIWFYAPHGELFAGLFIGSAFGMIVWIRNDPPYYIGTWKIGAEGERLTSKVLRPLESKGWRAFHDRDGGFGNLDHIMIGAAGVFLLDSKNLSGELTLEAEGLTAKYEETGRHDFVLNRLESSMRGASARLKERIESATQLRPWVQAVVVVWGNFQQGHGEGDRVVYVAGELLADWLVEQGERLASRDQRLIELALDAELFAAPASPVGSALTTGT